MRNIWWRQSIVRRISNTLALYYRPQRSCGQGNVFTGVCHSFCSQGGVCLSACWDTTPRDQTSPRTRQTPPPRTRQMPPGTRQTPPQDQTPPRPGRHPLSPLTRQTTPLGPGRPPLDQADPPPWGNRLQHTVYERPVRILLECILVRDILFIVKKLRIFAEYSWNFQIEWNHKIDFFS